MEYRSEEVPVDTVAVVGRHRTDLGDLGDLMASIERIKLINAITITQNGELIAGQRRLEAVRRLGWATIPARIVTDLNGAVERLVMERDENTARKPMTPGELVSLGRALEKLEAPRAVERKAEAGRSAAPGRPGEREDHVTPSFSAKGKTSEIVAGALGMSGASYNRAKRVVAAANDAALPTEQRAIAQAALADMNRTGKVFGSYEKVMNARAAPPKAPSIAKAADQRRTINRAVNALSGIAHGLKQIESLHPDLTDEEAALWVDGLRESRLTITVLMKRLKERTNVNA